MKFFRDLVRQAHISLLVCVVVPLVGCQTSSVLYLRSCPAPSYLAVSKIENLMIDGGYGDLIIWISEIERYCSAVDLAMEGM